MSAEQPKIGQPHFWKPTFGTSSIERFFSKKLPKSPPATQPNEYQLMVVLQTGLSQSLRFWVKFVRWLDGFFST
jgi:hypothetical protein